MKLFEFKVETGKEVMNSLQESLKDKNIREGAIVSVIGAVDECCISNMPKDDPRADNLNRYKEPLEMSGNGEIRDGKPHIHCVMSREGEGVLAGHLHWAKINTWYVKIFIMTS